MPRQIAIRWDSRDGGDYGASVQAMREYLPMPTIEASVRLKGIIPEQALADIVDIAGEYLLDMQVTITATWDDESEIGQLRLFGPPESVRAQQRALLVVNAPSDEGGEDGGEDSEAS